MHDLLELTEKLDVAARYDAIITLDYDSRKRGRLKTLTEADEEAGLFWTGARLWWTATI